MIAITESGHFSSDTKPSRVSIILECYNQERFVSDAVRALLNQTRQPDEIILSDDSSSDRTFEIIQQEACAYQGTAKLILNRNQKNLGPIAHMNYLMSLVTGDLVLAAAGDDISHLDRVEQTLRDWVEFGHPPLLSYGVEVFCESKLKRKPFVFRSESLQPGWMLEHINSTVLSPAMAWSRDVFDRFGPLPPTVPTEDKSIVFRAALLGKIVIRQKQLVRYRIHENNLSGKARLRNLSKQQIRQAGVEGFEYRLEGFAQDLTKAVSIGLIDGRQKTMLNTALARGRARLHHRRQIVFGSWWKRLTSRMALIILGRL